jgi:hypothetical protein
MAFDLRDHLEWEPAAANPAFRRVITEWTDQEPTPSMRFALPTDGHQWLWEIVQMLAPHSMPEKARCSEIAYFSARNEVGFSLGHAAWLRQMRPGGVDRIALLLRDNLIEMVWDEYAERFARLATHCLACTPDLSWMALGYFDEHIVQFRPRWDSIRAIARTPESTPGGTRVMIRFDDANPAQPTWQTGVEGGKTSVETLVKMAEMVSGVTGLPIGAAIDTW